MAPGTSKHEISTQCWANVVYGGPTLGGYVVSAENVGQAVLAQDEENQPQCLKQVSATDWHRTKSWDISLAVISKTCTGIIRSKIVFLESVTFQLHARMLSSEVAQSLKSYGNFRTLGTRSLSVTAMLSFSGKANTSIHGLGVDDTAKGWAHMQYEHVGCCGIYQTLKTWRASNHGNVIKSWDSRACAGCQTRDEIQQIRNVQPMLVQCWPSIVDDGPTLYQHWLNVSCLLERLCNKWIICIFHLFPGSLNKLQYNSTAHQKGSTLN